MGKYQGRKSKRKSKSKVNVKLYGKRRSKNCKKTRKRIYKVKTKKINRKNKERNKKVLKGGVIMSDSDWADKTTGNCEYGITSFTREELENEFRGIGGLGRLDKYKPLEDVVTILVGLKTTPGFNKKTRIKAVINNLDMVLSKYEEKEQGFEQELLMELIIFVGFNEEARMKCTGGNQELGDKLDALIRHISDYYYRQNITL